MSTTLNLLSYFFQIFFQNKINKDGFQWQYDKLYLTKKLLTNYDCLKALI